jgi:hypothetical protein
VSAPRLAPERDLRLEIARLVTVAHRDLDEAMHHVLHPDPPSPMALAVIRGRLLDAAGHAISAAHDALRL